MVARERPLAETQAPGAAELVMVPAANENRFKITAGIQLFIAKL